MATPPCVSPRAMAIRACGQDRYGLDGASDPITSNLYNAAEEGEVPDTAVKASLGAATPLPSLN
jgi:hypothetical protein